MKLIKNMNRMRIAIAVFALALISACDGETSSGSSGTSGSGGSSGFGGSTARMVIVDDFLYAIAENRIKIFSLMTPTMPNPWATVTVRWDIQTLFKYEDYILIGARDGIHIMDNSDRANPQLVGDLPNTATDPVVAAGGYAYVSVKSDPQSFDQVQDQINVIDLSDIRNPRLVNDLTMESPAGLVAVGNRLFVCDGGAGIKQYNLDDPVNPAFVDVIVGVNCNDVITNLNVDTSILYAITDTSLHQYDYSVSPPALLSIIESESMSSEALINALSGKLRI